MKTMKLFSMAAVALLMAACSNSDDFDVQKPAETAGVYHFEATIAAPDADASMRTVYTEEGTTINVKWKVGDQIALVHNGKKDVAEVKTVDNVTGKATIEATITGSPSDDDDVYLAYPADAVYSATPYAPFPFTPNPTTFDKVKSQDGTLGYIQDNLDLRMGAGKLAVSGDNVTLKESVSIPSLICIWKLTLQDNAATPSALSATKLSFKNNTFTQAEATSAAKSVYYLCVVPSFIPDASGTFSFEATVGSDTYTFSKTGLSLTAGKYYQSTVTMAIPATAHELSASVVGDVVGSNGKAYTLDATHVLPSGVTAVAMVAYKSGSNGLAIQLNSSPVGKDWDEAKTYAAGLTAVTGGTWRLPSKDDWQNMFVGCAVSGDASASNEMNPIAGFKAKIAATGITWQSSSYYWSSTESGMGAWSVLVSLGDSNAAAYFDQHATDSELAVLGCLAF